jgi:hypothetical protein
MKHLTLAALLIAFGGLLSGCVVYDDRYHERAEHRGEHEREYRHERDRDEWRDRNGYVHDRDYDHH